MATGKRYYWIKLRETFMASDTVDFLMSQRNGANYVVLYQLLCLKTINTGGRLSRTIGEVVIPYDVDKIQRDCKWFSADTIRVALNLYKRFGLIYEDVDGTLVLVEYDGMVGSETDWALQKRGQRDSPLLPPADGGGSAEMDAEVTAENVRSKSGKRVENVRENVHTDIRDKEIRDKSLEIREQRLDGEEDVVCAEPPDSGRSTPASAPALKPSGFRIPLNDGSFYDVPTEDLRVYETLYPKVDVPQALRNMIGWSLSAEANRKTRRGIKRFITNWLSRDQDKGRTRKPSEPQKRNYADEDDFY